MSHLAGTGGVARHPAQGAVAGGFYARRGKRLLDLALAGTALLALAGPMLLLAGLVRARLGAPILYREARAGRDGRTFRLCKFRSMSEGRDASGRLLPDEARLTPFGRALRRWSLDELPQLLNVLRGEMSLVGPRPLPTRYLPRYTNRERGRHAVRPGITGWAQIQGRNRLGWEEKFALDLWYVEHRGLGLDLKIMLLTLPRALRGGEVDFEGVAADHEFRGQAESARPSGTSGAGA